MMVLWRAWYLQSLATGPVIACDHSRRCTAGVAFASGRFVRMAQRPAANASAVSVSSRHVDIRVETIKQSTQSIHCPNMIWLYWLIWFNSWPGWSAAVESHCLYSRRNTWNRLFWPQNEKEPSPVLLNGEHLSGSDAVFSLSVHFRICWQFAWAFLLFGFNHLWVETCERRPEENRTLFFPLQSRCMVFCSQMWTLQGMWHMCCRHTLWVDGSQKGRRTWDKAGVSSSGSQCDQSAFIQPGDSGGLVLKMNWLGQDMSLIFMFASRALASDTKSIIKQQHS